MNKNKIFCLILYAFLLPFIIYSNPEDINDENFMLWEGFENANNWTTSDWQNNSLSNPKISTDFVTEGKKSLEIDLNQTNKNQTGMIQVFDTGNMSGVQKIKFDIYNSSLINIKICLMLKTGQNWVYHESTKRDIKPGWNKDIEFNFDTSDFGNTGIREPDKVRRFGIMFIPEKSGAGKIFLDNIRIKGNNIKHLLPVIVIPEKEELQEVLIDDFETGRLRWMAAGTWSCATNLEKTNELASSGNFAMKAIYNLKEPGQNAVYMIEDSVDLSDVYEMKIDVYYPDDFPANLSISLQTGDKWLWQEYKTIKLRKGWNKNVTFYFKDKKWKNENVNWANVTNPESVNNVRRICLLLFPANMGEGYVIFDNVRMKTKDPGKLANLRPTDLSNYAFYIFNSFEKGVQWQTQSDATGGLSARPAFNFGGENVKGMELVFATQSNVDKAAYVYRNKIDLSDACGIKFDVYNPMDYSVKITLAFQVGDEETWIESKQVGISPGWNRDIYFDFLSPSFKSAESNWNYTEYFNRRNDIRNIILSIFPDQKVSGRIYVTDFKLARHNLFGEIGKYAGFTLANNSRITVEPVKYKIWYDGNFVGSFENETAFNFWKPAKDPQWGVTELSLSSLYASRGKKSLKITYKDTNIKFGCVYEAAGILDISQYTSISFDIYNPGKMLKFTMAFTSTDNAWHEINKQIIINPGWNKNITIRFDQPIWKRISGGIQQGPMILSSKDSMTKMFFIFYNGYEGTLYLDNIRWGTKDDLLIKEAYSEQDVNFYITPNDNMELKVSARGAYYYDQNTDLNIKSGHLILRGFGNELTLFSGESVKVFDDFFGLVDTEATGTNMMGLTLAGTIYPINTSYFLTGISLDNKKPWLLGTSFLGSIRLKTYFLDKNYIGALYLNTRRGYDENPDIINGALEQSAHVFGGDTVFNIPIFDLMTINLKGEALMTYYQSLNPVYMLSGPPFQYAIETIPEKDRKMLTFVEGSMRYGYLTLYSYYRHVDNYFAAYYCNPDLRAGFINKDIKMTYVLDDIPPFSIIKYWGGDWNTFVRNTSLMIEYDAGKSTTDDYSRDTYTIDLKNDESLAFYNYHIWFRHNTEGNVDKIVSKKLSGFTKILLFDFLTFRLLGRIDDTRGAVKVNNTYEIRPYLQWTGFIETSIKITKDIILTGNYKHIRNEYETHNNLYAKLEANLWGMINMIISYGEEPLTGYWLDDNSNETVNKYTLLFKGRF
ncbi:MAG: hypothetical protein N3E50_01250 [Candidatus Goldbacteria bacterium]|nr:hypothetical protein [Candidatus Goldiibacteriota bacterium]